MSFASVGVHARNAATQTADKQAVQAAHVEGVKLLVGGNEMGDIDAYRTAGVNSFHARLYTEEPSHDGGMTAAKFVQVFTPAIQAYIAKGITAFEIHNEPNLTIEGYNVSWRSPQQFAAWFLQTVQGLRAQFGHTIRLGFPGLSPGEASGPRIVSDRDFMAGCQDAIAAADFLCVHTYWQSRAEMEDINGGLRFLKEYHEKFPDKIIVISEFANVGTEDWTTKGMQYAEFYTLCAQYSWIEVAYSFILSSPNNEFATQVWRLEDGTVLPVAPEVGARPVMPAPSLLRLAWPADPQYVGQITQIYGENQQGYYDSSGDQHWLHGGHAGIDLYIGPSDGAPIRAALSGQVIRSRFDPTGFGEMIRIQSIVPNVGTVELTYAHLSRRLVQETTPPMFVNQGDVIGLGGHTGFATGTHLHLAMKITSDPKLNDAMRPCSGYINPYPYLCWRGQPRADYPRTYLLLPPNKPKAWAAAAIQTTWSAARFTLGASADDAGIGNLSYRRVIAVNPGEWPSNLKAFFDRNFPGMEYVPVAAASPDDLAFKLTQLPGTTSPPPPPPPRGQPGIGRQYDRTYVLMPPQADATWAQAVADATWETKQYTIGGSADDAGIGDLNVRRIIAVNPSQWGSTPPLDQAWYDANYPGAQFVSVDAASPQELAQKLATL